MQLLPRYILNTRIRIILNEVGNVTEYVPMFSRQLELYKGIDNVIQFQILNADQKPVDISDKFVRLLAYDQNNKRCLNIPCYPVKWDDSTTRIGMVKATILYNDLLDIPEQYITYWVSITDYDGVEILTYSDVNFGNPGIAKVNQRLSPRPAPAKSTTFNAIAYNRIFDKQVWYSDPVYMDPGLNQNSALHTIAIYPNGYKGVFFTEITLEDNILSNDCVWTKLDHIIEFNGKEQEPIPFNFNGMFMYARFGLTERPPKTPPKILVRT